MCVVPNKLNALFFNKVRIVDEEIQEVKQLVRIGQKILVTSDNIPGLVLILVMLLYRLFFSSALSELRFFTGLLTILAIGQGKV